MKEIEWLGRFYTTWADLADSGEELDECRRHAVAVFDYLHKAAWKPEKAAWPLDENGDLLPKSMR